MKLELNCNYETYLVIAELRENHKFVDDVIKIANSVNHMDERVRAIRGYVDTWYLTHTNYNKYPLHKALWDSAYRQIDWIEVLKCFTRGSETWAVKDEDDDQ